MSWMSELKDILKDSGPWLTALPPLQKAIISSLIAGAAVFLLALSWTTGSQGVVPWLTTLSPLPKAIASSLIAGITAFILIVIWTPPPDPAINAILAQTYRKALFTRTHAQMSHEAMFASIAECREIVQRNIQQIRRRDLNRTAWDLFGALDQIERSKPIKGPDDYERIDRQKLVALQCFSELSAATGGRFTLPDRGSLIETTIFTKQEADGSPRADILARRTMSSRG